MNMRHWGAVTVPEMKTLIPTLRLMEGLHKEAGSYSTDQAKIEHTRLAESYREAIEYIEQLNREGLLPPF